MKFNGTEYYEVINFENNKKEVVVGGGDSLMLLIHGLTHTILMENLN